MNRFWLILLFAVCLYSCKKPAAGPCEGANCNDSSAAYLKPGAEAESLMPYRQGDTFSLVNDKGFIAHYTVSRDSSLKENVLRNDLPSDCCPYRNISYAGIVISATMKTAQVPIEIGMTVQKNSYGFWNVPPEEVHDLVSVSINETTWGLPLETDISYLKHTNQTELLDTLTLNNTLYTHVYHLYYTDTLNPVMKPMGVYLNDQGLLGFYFTTGEKWYRR